MRKGFGCIAARAGVLAGIVGIALVGCSDSDKPSSSPQQVFPVIEGFFAGSHEIAPGSSTTLTARFRNGTATIDQGIGAVKSGVPVTISPTETTTYTLTASGGGKTVTHSLVVSIVKPVPVVGTWDNVCDSPPVQAVSGVDQNVPTPEGATCLPFGITSPLPGALAIAADGRTAAHISTTGDVALWDAVDIKPLDTIPFNGKKPSAVALSPDGNLIAIGYFDSSAIVMSRREKKVLWELKDHAGGISALAFSPDGLLLASGGGDATTQLWEVSSGKKLRIFDSQFGDSSGGIVSSLGFSGNGRALIVNEWYSRFYDVGRGTTLWDVETGVEISTRDVAPPNTDNTMRSGQAIGGRGWLLAYTGPRGLMAERLDRCESGHQFPSGQYAETVAADPQGRWVAAAEVEKLTFFGMSGNTNSYSVTLPTRAIALVAHPDGRFIIGLMTKQTRINGNENFIAGRDAETVTGGALYRIPVPEPLWNLPPLIVKADAGHCPATESARLQQDFHLPEKPVELMVAEQASDQALMEKTILQLLDEKTQTQGNSGFISDMDTGQLYKIAEGQIERYGADSKLLQSLKTKETVIALAARNGRLAALYANGDVQVWNTQTGKKPRTFKSVLKLEEGYGIDDSALSSDGRYLQLTVSGSGDAPTEYPIYDLTSSKQVAQGPLLAPFPGRSNRGIVQDTRPQHLAVWDFDKREIIARLPRHQSRDQNGRYIPLRAAISDDGKLLASASNDGSIRVWDINARQLVGEANLKGVVTAMAFNSHGTELAVGMPDIRILILQVSASHGQLSTTAQQSGASASAKE